MIWFGRTNPAEHRYRGTSKIGKLLNALTLDMENCRANEERIYRLRNIIRSKGKRVASIGCGCAIEWWGQDLQEHDLFLLDQDEGALARAKEKLNGRNVGVTFCHQNILKFILRASRDAAFGKRDFIYAFGLFDYFDDAAAARLTRSLFETLKPGGTLLVTNAHPDNPTRLWMEWGGEWCLKYKTEPAMMSFAEGLSDVGDIKLERDSFGIYQYLEIQRKA